MTRRKKISLCIGAGLGILLVLVSAFLILLPRMINLEPVRQRILAGISHKVGAQVECQRIDLSFLPRPVAVIHKARLSIQGKLSGTMRSLTIHPTILPVSLSAGLSRVQVEAPDFTFQLQEMPETDQEKSEGFPLADIEEKVRQVVASKALREPGLVIDVRDGRIDLSRKHEPVVRFREVRAHIDMRQQELEAALTCTSNLCEHLALEGRLDPKDFNACGHIDLTHLKPQVLTEHFFPNASRRVGESTVDLRLSFRTDGFSSVHTEINGSIPCLTVHRRDETVLIKGKSLKGVLHLAGDKTTVSLTKLDLEQPHLEVTGELIIDETFPRVSLKLEGEDVDVDSTREAALALAGDVSATRDIFDRLKGGKIPRISFHASGNCWKDLGKLENMFIRASIREGKISVPRADLDLDEVVADVVVSDGILEAKNLAARMGRSHGSQGALKLGLRGEKAPFHLDILVNFDLTQLPRLLNRFVKNEAFQRELRLFHGLHGNATGKLVLGESTKSIETRIEVSRFNLAADYERIPYPLTINGENFSYQNRRIQAKSLSGAVGKSPFSRLSGTIDWTKQPYLLAECGKALIFLEEIHPWLSSFEKPGEILGSATGVEGTVALSGLNVEGPFLSPEDWHFQTRGSFESVAMDSDLLSGRMTINRGQFSASSEGLTVVFSPGAVATWDESRISLEGVLKVSSAGLLVNGELAADRFEWSTVKKLLEKKQTAGDIPARKDGSSWPLLGNLRFRSENFTWADFTWSPFIADISFGRDRVDIAVSEAVLCGISTPGTLSISPSDIQVNFDLVAEKQKLDPTMACFWNRKGLMTGDFTLGGKVTGPSKGESFARSLRGRTEFRATDGRIYRFGLLAKIFAVLNVTEVFRGKLPDLAEEGFAYDSITIEGNLCDGKFVLDKAFVDGSSMGIAFDGDVDLVENRLNLNALVAPLKTVDFVLDKIPLAGHLLGGSLVSIPMKVTGNPEDPTVRALSPSAVGSRLLGIMKRTLQLPVKIIQPLLPDTEEKQGSLQQKVHSAFQLG